MWFRNIFLRSPQHKPTRARRPQEGPLFDELFLRRLQRMSLQAQRTLQGNPANGGHVSRQYMPASEFSDHRPYFVGDDLRYVDWNAYARQDEMLLKLGEAEQNLDIHILLDASRSMAWGNPSKLRLMQQLAGAVGYLVLSYNDRLHIVPFGSQALRPFGPTRGKGRLVEMLRYIEQIPVQQTTELRTILQQHAQQYKRGGMLILCSDLLIHEGLADGLRLLPPPRWQVVVLHLLDPRELRPELQGPFELEDSETGQRISVALDAEQIAAYHQGVQEWQENLKRLCGRYGATYAPVMTTWPLEQKIVPYLRARRLLT
ncbi:MAG: DUF58 domain-containing protein [Chloroflexaceae bacterium]|nr:DUF58 domain-containing protein [Chloroflexaceae bacterium]